MANADEPEPQPEPEVGRERDRPTGFELAWGLRPPARRGPKPGLTLEGIVATAMDIADRDGLASVSMSKVAKAQGFTTMSLYRYVPTKDDLVLLMFDASLGEPPDLGPMRPWRTGVEKWALAILEGYRSHPWVLDVLIAGVPMTPNQLRWLDLILRSFTGTNLGPQDQLTTALVLDGYVRSWVQIARGFLQPGTGPTVGAPTDPDQLLELVDPERFPALAPVLASGALTDDDDDDFETDFEEMFAFGLERVLDGIAVLIEELGGESDPDE